MREGVPDLIAQEFLKNFLSALQQNKSVFCALREARERLQAWDKDFPEGSWLPMICQNLSVSNNSIFKIPFDDKSQQKNKNQSNVKIFFYSIVVFLLIFIGLNINNYFHKFISFIPNLSNLFINNKSEKDNISFEHDAKMFIENLYKALSTKDFILAETFYDVKIKEQFNPKFVKQFKEITAENLEVIYQDINTVQFIGENNYIYLDNTNQIERRNYTVSKIDNQLKIISSNFIEVIKPR